MLKKIMLLGAAIAALVAVAAPAVQAEFKVTTNGSAITEHDIVSFEGEYGFEFVGGAFGWHATVEATITLKAGTVEVGDQIGLVTEFHVSNCTGTGELEGFPCTPTTTEVNWPVTLKAQDELEIHVELHQIYYADAGHTIPVATTVLEGPAIADLDDPKDVTVASLTGGEGLTMNGHAATITGDLDLTGTNVLGID